MMNVLLFSTCKLFFILLTFLLRFGLKGFFALHEFTGSGTVPYSPALQAWRGGIALSSAQVVFFLFIEEISFYVACFTCRILLIPEFYSPRSVLSHFHEKLKMLQIRNTRGNNRYRFLNIYVQHATAMESTQIDQQGRQSVIHFCAKHK